jgi:hypothetical protein
LPIHFHGQLLVAQHARLNHSVVPTLSTIKQPRVHSLGISPFPTSVCALNQ